MAAKKLAREREIGDRAARHAIIEKRGQTMAGRLGEADISRNDGAIYPVAEVGEELRRHLIREIVAGVVHGSEYPLDLQARIEL